MTDDREGDSGADGLRRRELLYLGTVAGTGSLAGCSMLPGRWGDPDPELDLEATAAQPGTTVAIEGDVEALGEEPLAWFYDATVEDPGEDDRHPAYVDVDLEVLVVPVHPAAPMEGGPSEVEIVSEDEEFRTGRIDFEVEPLEPAPGTIEAVLDTVEDAILRGAENLGYDRETLLEGDLGEFPAHLGGMAAALRVVASDGDENNLRAMLSGEAPMADAFDDGEDGREVAEAVAAASGLPDSADRLAETVGADDISPEVIESLYGAPPDEAARVRPGGAGDGPRAYATARPAPVTDARYGGTPPNLDGVSEPVALDLTMKAQAEYADMNSGDQKVARDAKGLAFAAVGVIPPAQILSVIGGVYVLAEKVVIEIGEGTLPSTLDDLQLAARPTEYDEDEYDVEGKTNAGEWEASLLASSEGVSFGWADIAGAVPVGKFVKAIERFADQTEVMEGLAESIAGYVEEIAAGAWGANEDGSPIEIAPETFGPIAVDPEREDEEDFFLWELRTLSREDDAVDPFAFIDGDTRYEPRGVGTTELRAETNPDAFVDEYVSADPVELAVNPIEVVIESAGDGSRRDIYRLDPEGDLALDFRAVVENARDETVDWNLELVEGPDGAVLAESGTDNHHAQFVAGNVEFDEATLAAYRIRAESVTEDGLREGLDPTRDGEVVVLITDEDPELVVSDVTCVGTGDTFQFTALLDGKRIGFDQLDWTVTGPGSLDGDGLFYGESPGEVAIEFEYETYGGKAVTETVEFEVSDSCSSLSVTTSYFSYTSDCVAANERSVDDIRHHVETSPDEDLHVGLRIPLLGPDRGPPPEGEWEVTIEYVDYFWGIDMDPDSDTEYAVQGPPMTWWAGRNKVRAPEAWERVMHWDDSIPSSSPYAPESDVHYGSLTIRRREREIDGETVGVYSGSFATQIKGRRVGSSIFTDVYGEFTGVIPPEYRSCHPGATELERSGGGD